MDSVAIQHQPKQQRFVLQLAGHEAVLDYQLHQNEIDFHHTFVPVEFRGKGLAEKLVRTGLSWAQQQHFTIHASCSYVQRFLR
jgi:uncharacterized protein